MDPSQYLTEETPPTRRIFMWWTESYDPACKVTYESYKLIKTNACRASAYATNRLRMYLLPRMTLDRLKRIFSTGFKLPTAWLRSCGGEQSGLFGMCARQRTCKNGLAARVFFFVSKLTLPLKTSNGFI